MRELALAERRQVAAGDAYIDVQAGHVDITVPIQFVANGVPQSEIDAMIAKIESDWHQTYAAPGGAAVESIEVTVHVQQIADARADPRGNIVELFSGATPNQSDGSGNNGHSYVKNSVIGYWSMADQTNQIINGTVTVKGPSTASHELGHLLGLPDVAGDRGNMMDGGKGTKISDADVIQMLLNSSNTVRVVHTDGTGEGGGGGGDGTADYDPWTGGGGYYDPWGGYAGGGGGGGGTVGIDYPGVGWGGC